MEAGVAGSPFTDLLFDTLAPQLLVTVAVIFPVPKLLLKATLMLLVPCPLEMVAPAGTVQL